MRKDQGRTMLHFSILLVALLALKVEASNVARENYGASATHNDQAVAIDKSFVKRLSEQPSINEWKRNRWELVYLINVGDVSARSVGIELLARANPDSAKHDDDDLVRPLARAISQTPQFWTLLSKKPAEVQNKVLGYFDLLPEDYTGYDKADYAWQKQQLLSGRKKK